MRGSRRERADTPNLDPKHCSQKATRNGSMENVVLFMNLANAWIPSHGPEKVKDKAAIAVQGTEVWMSRIRIWICMLT